MHLIRRSKQYKGWRNCPSQRRATKCIDYCRREIYTTSKMEVVMEYRIEHDSMGEVKVPADRLWGAQTERSHENFPIGVGIETMPAEIIHAFGILKKAAAQANHALVPERMTDEKLEVIVAK